MIAVGPKLSGDAFYQHDLDLLMTLANQAGVAIKNAQLYAAVVVANEYLENIAATIESGVIAIDATGRVAMFNRAAEQLTGLAAESDQGRPGRRAARLPGRAVARHRRRRASAYAAGSRAADGGADARGAGQPAGHLHDLARSGSGRRGAGRRRRGQ